MKWAVHNLHIPAVEIDNDGTYTLDGVARIKLGEPLKTFNTKDAAEGWRKEIRDGK